MTRDSETLIDKKLGRPSVAAFPFLLKATSDIRLRLAIMKRADADVLFNIIAHMATDSMTHSS